MTVAFLIFNVQKSDNKQESPTLFESSSTDDFLDSPALTLTYISRNATKMCATTEGFSLSVSRFLPVPT